MSRGVRTSAAQAPGGGVRQLEATSNNATNASSSSLAASLAAAFNASPSINQFENCQIAGKHRRPASEDTSHAWSQLASTPCHTFF